MADGEGECWECANLFIADASAFPTASGRSSQATSAVPNNSNEAARREKTLRGLDVGNSF